MHSTPNKLPPCIVLGLETQIGLSIVRELGRAGVPVIGIAQEYNAIGLKSRYLARSLVISNPRSSELISEIRALGEELGECCLITVSEANLIWLASHRNEFGTVKPIIPPQAALEIVLDKQRTLQTAQSLGITVPETAEPSSMAEVERLAGRLRFPVVLKWKDPNAALQYLRPNGIELVKAEYAYSAEEFLHIARRYLPAEMWPLVQEYCPGIGLGQFFYMHEGVAIRRFQHIRIAEWPPEGGFSSVCDAVPLVEHQELQEQSIALLQAIGWQGVAMVEYRFDPLAERAVLMEINGRYWGSYPLAMHSGASFALLSYYLESQLGIPPMPAVRQDMRCRMVVTELKRLWRIWFHPHLIADRSFTIRRLAESFRFISDFFRPRVCYYVWTIGDPGPFMADVRNLFHKLLRRNKAI